MYCCLHCHSNLFKYYCYFRETKEIQSYKFYICRKIFVDSNYQILKNQFLRINTQMVYLTKKKWMHGVTLKPFSMRQQVESEGTQKFLEISMNLSKENCKRNRLIGRSQEVEAEKDLLLH